MLVGWIGYLSLAAAWGVIATFISLYVGYRQYVRQEDEREKRCHHTLDTDEHSILLQALDDCKERASRQEFGLYSFFMHDDGHASYSWYRSDPTFEKEQLINPLSEVCDGYSSLLGWWRS